MIRGFLKTCLWGNCTQYQDLWESRENFDHECLHFFFNGTWEIILFWRTLRKGSTIRLSRWTMWCLKSHCRPFTNIYFLKHSSRWGALSSSEKCNFHSSSSSCDSWGGDFYKCLPLTGLRVHNHYLIILGRYVSMSYLPLLVQVLSSKRSSPRPQRCQLENIGGFVNVKTCVLNTYEC